MAKKRKKIMRPAGGETDLPLESRKPWVDPLNADPEPPRSGGYGRDYGTWGDRTGSGDPSKPRSWDSGGSTHRDYYRTYESGRSTESKNWWEKEQERFKDWFGRKKEDDYSYSSDRNKLIDWDKGRKTYSSFFSSSWREDGGRKKESARIVKSMASLMGETGNSPFSGHLDTNHIYLPFHTIPTGYKESDDVKMDAFYGACLGNIAEKTMQTKKEYEETIARHISLSESPSIDAYFQTLINDERIHRKVSEEFSGYSKFIQKFKSFKYKGRPTEFSSNKEQFLDMATRIIRYPDEIKEKECTAFTNELSELKKIIDSYGGIPSDYGKAQNLSSEISSFMRRFLDGQETKMPDYGFGKREKAPETPEPGSGEMELQTDEMDQKMEGNCSGSREAPPEFKESESLAKLYKSMVRDYKIAQTKEQKEYAENLAKQFNSALSSDSGEIPIVFETPDLQKVRYEWLLSKVDMTKVRTISQFFKRLPRDHKFHLRAMKSGRLDTAKLAEAVQGVPTVYERIGRVKTPKICLGVLVDESGSMSWGKEDYAAMSVIMLHEAFKKVQDVELFIYGHTADQYEINCVIRTYKEPGKDFSPYLLGDIRGRAENRDGLAILETAKRIRKQTPNQGILIVISDGSPCADSYGGDPAIKDTREKVKKAEALGFDVIQIAIESYVPSEKMFTHYVKFTDLSSLPATLVNYMRKLVRNKIKEKVIL